MVTRGGGKIKERYRGGSYHLHCSSVEGSSCTALPSSIVLHWSAQMAGIIQAERAPPVSSPLEDIEATGILLNAPYLVQIKAKKCTGEDLVDNLMANQSDSLTGTTSGHFL